MTNDELFADFDAALCATEYDVSLYRGDADGDPEETAVEKQQELISSLRSLAKAASALADALELVDAAPPTVSDLRAIFGEPVEGRDYDVMPPRDAESEA